MEEAVRSPPRGRRVRERPCTPNPLAAVLSHALRPGHADCELVPAAVDEPHALYDVIRRERAVAILAPEEDDRGR